MPRRRSSTEDVQEAEIVPADPVAERSDRRQIVADAGDEPGEHVDGGPEGEHEGEQQQVGLTQAPDAAVHARDHRRQRDGSDAADQQHLGRVGVRDAEQMGQPGRGLLDSEPERRASPKSVANTARISMTWSNRPHTASPRTE